MKSRQGYKGYVIVARSCELREGEFSAEFSVEEHDADGIMETEFYLPDTFPTQESAIEAAVQALQKMAPQSENRLAVCVFSHRQGHGTRCPIGDPDALGRR